MTDQSTASATDIQAQVLKRVVNQVSDMGYEIPPAALPIAIANMAMAALADELLEVGYLKPRGVLYDLVDVCAPAWPTAGRVAA